MIAFALALAVASAAAEAAEDKAQPSSQDLVFLNARMALREGRSREVLKHWLLHNALEDRGEYGARL